MQPTISNFRKLKKSISRAEIPEGIPHFPNKNEASVLRKLMSQTGLTELELREHKAYRILLSEAQKQQGSKSYQDRALLRTLKQVTRQVKLPLDHPKTKEAWLALWEEKQQARFFVGSVYSMNAHEAWKKVIDCKKKA